MLIGLSGAQGTGKSYLAKKYSEKYRRTKFYPTTASAVFKELGFDPAAVLSIEDRLLVQERILEVFGDAYRALAVKKSDTIVDRTPIDFVAYTFAQIDQSSVTDSQADRFRTYIDNCYKLTNLTFGQIITVPPAITVAAGRDGKASSNEAYIEKVNLLIYGALCDERQEVQWSAINRDCIDINKRVQSVREIIKDSKIELDMDKSEYEHEGGSLH